MSFQKKNCLFILLVLLFFPHSALSLNQSNQTVMNTSVKFAPNVILTMTSGNSFCPPSNVTVIADLINVGNDIAVGNLAMNAYNIYGFNYMSGNWSGVSINPVEEKFYNISRQVSDYDPAGIYSAESNFSYYNTYAYSSLNFRIKQGIGTLVASPSRIEETALPGDTIVKDIYLWLIYPCHGASAHLNTTSGPPGSWVFFSSNPVWLSTDIYNVTRSYIYIDLPSNTTAGDYVGQIDVLSEGQHVIIPLIIHIQPTIIFDVITEVLPQYKEVCAGNVVVAKVTATKIFPPGMIDINLTYRIEFNGTTYAERKETVAIDSSIQKYVTLTTLSNLPEGNYLFSTSLQYNSTNAYSYDLFSVKSCPIPTTTTVPPSPGGGGGRGLLPVVTKPPSPISLELSRYRLYTILGNITGFIAKVENLMDKDVMAIRLDVSGVPIEWLKMSPYRLNLKPNETKSFVVAIDVPADADEGIYYLSIQAKDEYKSDERQLALIVAKDLKSLARLALENAENVSNRANGIRFLNCLGIGDLLKDLNDSNMILDSAKGEYEAGRYENTISLADFAVDSYEKIMTKAEGLMENVFGKLPTFAFPPFSEEFEKENEVLVGLMVEKNYVEFCDSFRKIQNLSFYSTVEVVLIVSLISISMIILIAVYRRKKAREISTILERVKERLGIGTE